MYKKNIKIKKDDKSIKKPISENNEKKRTNMDIVKEKKNTRRRLSISTKIDLPDDTDEIKRSIQELKHNEDKFKESSENVTTRRVSENEVQVEVEGEEDEEEERRKKLDKKKRTLKNRSSVAGVRASHFQEDFEKKCVKIKGSVEKLHENGIGYVCRKGLKPESPNQDDFIIITMENLALYAIFDGHGPYGHDVSNYVQKELPYMIIKNENFLKNPKEVFTKAFLNIHENIERTTNAYLDSFTNKNSNNKLHINSNFVINDQALESMQGFNNYTDSDTNSDDSYDYDDTIEDDEDEEDDEEDESNDNKEDDDQEEEAQRESNSSIDDEFNINKENKKTKEENDPDIKEEKSLTTKKKKQTKKKMKKRKKKKNKIFFDSTMSGTTATIIVHLFKEKKLYVAYVGDSRAVLGKRKNGSKQLSAVELTKDHKPNCAAEKRRILSSGGQVMKLEGDIPYRVFIKNKFYPGLAMSRAIGDTIGHQIGIIAEPDFIEVNINEDEDILVLICSDGVWEFISSEEAVNLIYEFGYNNVQDAVENLARESWDRWLNEEENIVDDITIQAIYLSEKSKYLK